ncbi:hypothetical protein CsSME_00031320 [Camellia sinensis var. sinensis]
MVSRSTPAGRGFGGLWFVFGSCIGWRPECGSLSGGAKEKGEAGEGEATFVEMRLKLLSWNMALLTSVGADMVCIQETKKECLGWDVIKEIWGGRCIDWVFLPASGMAGGVLVCWDSRVLVGEETEVRAFSVSCLFRCVEDGFCWVFTRVYGPVQGVKRRMFLEELQCVAFWWESLWCVVGDFNIVRWPGERSRGGRISGVMQNFFDLVDEGDYTWSQGRVSSRIDRFLVTGDWKEHFSRAVQRRLPRLVSDHWPILLDGGGIRRGPSPFRFENIGLWIG